MTITKNITDIISIQNSCKDIVQELYTYESRANNVIRNNYKNAKIDDAIRFDIIEYDNYDDELALSSDTEDYYKTRLGQQDETNISFISDKLEKLKTLLQTYNIRKRNNENTDKNIKQIYKLLNQIPSLLRYNLQAISSNSIFAFKNEPNFDIKMINLNICQDEITQLTDASNKVDIFIKEEKVFLKSINNKKINSAILKLQKNSFSLESAFRKLFEDIKNFINQSIKDGEFIKKLKKLQELKIDGELYDKTNIEELVNIKPSISSSVKEKKLLRDDRLFDFMENIQDIISSRKLNIINTKEDAVIDYDIDKKITLKRIIYNYPKLNKEFLSQDNDLITFLQSRSIEKIRLLGVFVRMIKNFASNYNMENNDFIQVENRIYKIVLAK
jgi:hypothetical protein